MTDYNLLARVHDLAGNTVTRNAVVSVLTGTVTKADPTKLPLANGQVRNATFAYGRNLAAGQTYIDPVTGVTVLKLTSATYPVANTAAMKGYATSGPRISQPWVGSDGHTYYTIALDSPNGFIDLRYDTFASSNFRDPGINCAEVDMAFSLNQATPRHCFSFTGGNVLRRYDTATGNEVVGNGFPKTISGQSSIRWLQTQLNDTWIAFMNNSNHVYLAYKPSTNVVRTMTGARSGLTHDELHLDLLNPIVYLSTDNEPNANAPWNLETDTLNKTANGVVFQSDDHCTPGLGFVGGMGHWQANGGAYTYQGDINKGTHIILTTAEYHSANADFYHNGAWCMNTRGPNVVDQWFVTSREFQDNAGTKIRRYALAFVKADGSQLRLIGHHDSSGNSGDTYFKWSKPSLSPDGKLLMWTSDMNGSNRTDVFVAKIPVS